jgi:SAM-dependent methyltransferase
MSGAAGETDSEAFYDRHWEGTETATDPHVVQKADRILRMIPPGVRSIADVGCGDGYLTHRLAERYEVTAIDRSAVALARARARALRVSRVIQASADALPLADRAVDMAFSSEMLEHLPDDILGRAAVELERVADRYLFVTVPHRETLRRRFVRCPRCRLEFHVDGHLRSFDPASLDRLFPGFERIAIELAGPLEPPAYAPIEWLRQHVCRHWCLWDGLKVTCPRCAEAGFRKPGRNALHRGAERALDKAAALWSRRTGRQPLPYWLMAVYRRREAS